MSLPVARCGRRGKPRRGTSPTMLYQLPAPPLRAALSSGRRGPCLRLPYGGGDVGGISGRFAPWQLWAGLACIMRLCRAFSAVRTEGLLAFLDSSTGPDEVPRWSGRSFDGSITHMIKFARALLLGTVATYPAIAGQGLGEAIRQNPECRQFNDGCSICQMVDGQAICSTPGIACITTEWYCLEGEQGTEGLRTPSRMSGIEE